MEEAGVYERKCIRPVYCNVASQRRARKGAIWQSQRKEVVQVATPVSCGIKDPQARTSHTDWMLTTQKAIIRSMIRRVNSGRRNTYDRVRARLTWGIIDAMEAMAADGRSEGAKGAKSAGLRLLLPYKSSEYQSL